MGQPCQCGQGMVNLGTGGRCPKYTGYPVRYIFAPMKKSNGDDTFASKTTASSPTFLDDTLYAVPADRWQITPAIETAAGTSPEKQFEVINNNSYAADITPEMIEFQAVGVPDGWQAKIESLACQTGLGIFYVDNNGALVGRESDGKIYPFRVRSQTIDATTPGKNDPAAARGKTTVKLYLEKTEWTGLRGFIDGSSFDENPLYWQCMSTLILSLTNPTVDGVTATVTTEYGEAGNKDKFVGLLTANFQVFNVTDSLPVASTASEVSPGVYQIAFTVAQTAADSVTVSLDKDAYEAVPKTAVLV